jgi:hypothetical protein
MDERGEHRHHQREREEREREERERAAYGKWMRARSVVKFDFDCASFDSLLFNNSHWFSGRATLLFLKGITHSVHCCSLDIGFG